MKAGDELQHVCSSAFPGLEVTKARVQAVALVEEKLLIR